MAASQSRQLHRLSALRFVLADAIDVAEVREILDDVVQDDYRASEIFRRFRAVVRKGARSSRYSIWSA